MIELGPNEVLRVTPEGKFIWAENADEMIERGDFSASPAMPHILRALRLNAELVDALKHAAWCVRTNYLPDKMGYDWDDVIQRAEASNGS